MGALEILFIIITGVDRNPRWELHRHQQNDSSLICALNVGRQSHNTSAHKAHIRNRKVSLRETWTDVRLLTSLTPYRQAKPAHKSTLCTHKPILCQLYHAADSHQSQAIQAQCCFTSTETIRTIMDGVPRTATSTFTQLLSSGPSNVEVLLYVHRNRRFITDGSPGRPPRHSHSSWALMPSNRLIRVFISTSHHGLCAVLLTTWTYNVGSGLNVALRPKRP